MNRALRNSNATTILFVICRLISGHKLFRVCVRNLNDVDNFVVINANNLLNVSYIR